MAKHRFANPSPLGLCAFALTTIVLSMHNAGIGIPYGSANNIIVSLAFFYGGLAQMLAGMWDFANGVTFGATAFTSYGAFWMSFAAILTPGFGILSSIKAGGHAANSLGIFLLGWVIFTFIMMIASYRATLMMAILFTLLEITFIFLCIGEWRVSKTFMTLGGSFGFVTALIAFYIAATHLINTSTGFSDLFDKSLAKPEDTQEI
ncbi:hypothetical protein BB559_001927 [Furculomyces boomerangus]|uniref:Ammonia transport outward protein 2 n=1 Tax=Furculomyces boomerangus TaxID=61424 RepID=A0A2T9YZN8_9FUNG|nr:hypothetical protein BB559_001927 [Furculomyces boomerangus]